MNIIKNRLHLKFKKYHIIVKTLIAIYNFLIMYESTISLYVCVLYYIHYDIHSFNNYDTILNCYKSKFI